MVFVLPREAALHYCSIRAKREVSGEREKNDFQSSLWRTLWGGGNVDTVSCSCKVKQQALPGLRVYLGWWMQGVRGDESCLLFALWGRKECTFPFLVKVIFSKREGTEAVWQYLQPFSTAFPAVFIQMFVSLKPCKSDCNWIFVVCIYVLQCNSIVFRYSTEWMNKTKCPLSQTFYFFVTKTSEIDF